MGTGGRAQNLGLISSLQLCCLWRDDECPGLSWPIRVCNLQLWHYFFIHNLLTSAHKCAKTLFWFEDSAISTAETVDRLHETCYDWLWRISSLEGRVTKLLPYQVFLLCSLFLATTRPAGGPDLGPGSPDDPPDVFQPRPSAVSSQQSPGGSTINTCSRSRAAIVLAPQPRNKQFVKLYHTIIPSIPST